MKRVLIILTALIGLTASAQNPEAIQKKIDKNSTSVQDPKKSKNQSVWIERAGLFYDLSDVYTSKLIPGLSAYQAVPMYGRPLSSEKVTLGGNDYIKHEYPNFTVYSTPGTDLFQFWVTKNIDYLGALKSSYESLTTAKELASEFPKKATDIAAKVADAAASTGRTYYSLNDPKTAFNYFELSSKASNLIGKVDTTIIFFSAVSAINTQNWETALPILQNLKSMNYSGDGYVDIYTAACYDNMKQPKEAIKTLEAAFEKDPNNANILASLINVYLTNNIDPEKLITIVKKAEELDPDNFSLYLVEGTVWEKIGNFDNAVKSFEKSISMSPKNFASNFNLARLYYEKADKLSEGRSKLHINDQKNYTSLSQEIRATKDLAIKYFESAHEANKTDETTIEVLRYLYFEKVDRNPELKDRFDYYDNLFKQITEQNK